MLFIKVRTLSKCEEKLCIICIFTAVCHSQHTSPTESQPLMKLILKRCTINGLPSSPSASRISSLYHKPRNHSMKNSIFIISIKCQLDKIATSKWGFFGPKLDLYVSISCGHYNFCSCRWLIFRSDGVVNHLICYILRL